MEPRYIVLENSEGTWRIPLEGNQSALAVDLNYQKQRVAFHISKTANAVLNKSDCNCIGINCLRPMIKQIHDLFIASEQWHAIHKFNEERVVFANLAAIDTISRTHFRLHIQDLRIDFTESLQHEHQAAQHSSLVKATHAFQKKHGTASRLTFTE